MWLLRSWSTLYIAVLRCKVSWFYFSYFNLSLLTESAYAKVNFSWNFSCSAKEAVLLPLSWSSMQQFQNVWSPDSSFFNFNLPQLIQRASAKGNISSNFRCSGKEAVLLLRSWSTLYVAVLKCILSWLWLFFLICQHLPKIYVSEGFVLEILGALRKKQFYCFVRGGPWIWHFQNVKCPDSISLILICHF